MVLSANTPLSKALGEKNAFPVVASTKIYEGAIVGDNAAGYARGLVAGDKFRGHAVAQADNSAGLAGDRHVTVYTGRYRLEVTLTGVAITDVGRKVYASADDTLTFVANGNSYVGRVSRYITTNTAEVEFDTTSETYASRLNYVNIANSTAIGASSTAEADFDKYATIAGARLKVGDVIRVRAAVVHTGSNTGHTLTVKLKLGTEEIGSSGALTIGAQNDVVLVEADIVVRVIGASGSVAGIFKVLSILNAAKAISALAVKSAATEDISGDTVLKLTGTYGTSNANNTAVLAHLTVEVLDAKSA